MGDRRRILQLLEEERQLIIRRFLEAERVTELEPTHHLPWYLDISKDWGVIHLSELNRLPKGELLDIGAYCGLISGVASRWGWKVSAVDVVPVPEYSGLRIPERNISCQVCNVCVDPLPFPDEQFQAVLLSEVIEHLVYSPLPMLREIQRVMKPGGALLISTPNPACLSKLIKLALGRNPLEPHIDVFLAEETTYNYKGLTFFKSNRESKLWTVGEIKQLLSRCDLHISKSLYYGNTVIKETDPLMRRLKIHLVGTFSPLLQKTCLGGGGIFVLAHKPSDAEK